MPFVHQGFDQIMVRHGLLPHDGLLEFLLAEKLDDLLQVLLQVLLGRAVEAGGR
jgi:hypothetical protein